MITQSQIEERIKYILPLLPPEVSSILKKCWKGNDLPAIFTDPKIIDSNPFTSGTKKASSMLGIHFYRLDRITEAEIDGIILHELGHDYCFTTGKHDYELYRDGPEDYRKRVESEICFLVVEWIKYIRHNNKVGE